MHNELVGLSIATFFTDMIEMEWKVEINRGAIVGLGLSLLKINVKSCVSPINLYKNLSQNSW